MVIFNKTTSPNKIIKWILTRSANHENLCIAYGNKDSDGVRLHSKIVGVIFLLYFWKFQVLKLSKEPFKMLEIPLQRRRARVILCLFWRICGEQTLTKPQWLNAVCSHTLHCNISLIANLAHLVRYLFSSTIYFSCSCCLHL